METLILIVILVMVVKNGTGNGSDHWRSSRELNRRSTRGRSAPKRAASAVQHDVGYWVHQVSHAFPQTRHGISSGWHAGRTAQAQGLAQRQQARTEHLTLRARLVPEILEHRRRQAEALEQIRAAQQPEPEPEPQTCIHGVLAPCGICDAGPAYSWGRADLRYQNPAAGLAEAVAGAREHSQSGTPYQVYEYPPGGGPGRLIATYGSPVPLSPGYLAEAQAIRDGFEYEDCEICGRGRDNHVIRPDVLGHAHAYCEEDDETPGEGSPPGVSPAPSTTEGPAMPASADTTYTQQLREFSAIRDDAEAEVNSVAVKRMMNRLDILTSLGLDKDSLEEAAAIDDALREQQKAAQNTLDAADTATHGLQTRHGGIKQATDDAPIDQPAQPEFYAD